MMRRHVFVTAVVRSMKRRPGTILGLVLLLLVGVGVCSRATPLSRGAAVASAELRSCAVRAGR